MPVAGLASDNSARVDGYVSKPETEPSEPSVIEIAFQGIKSRKRQPELTVRFTRDPVLHMQEGRNKRLLLVAPFLHVLRFMPKAGLVLDSVFENKQLIDSSRPLYPPNPAHTRQSCT